MPLDGYQETQLTGGGDTLLHYHLADRATNEGLQSDARRLSVTSDYTIRANDDFLLVDTSGGAINLTLPRALNGKEYEIVKMTAPNTLMVYPATGQTINGATSMMINLQWTAIRLKANDTGWIII